MLERVTPPRDRYPPASADDTCAQGPRVETVFADLHAAKAIILAVSGGPDSVALMLLAADWAKTESTPPLFVATVDHGLRAQSRHEAEQVALWAKALGLPHRLLSWDGEKPKTRIQERARDARYALLCAYASEIGADYILTAHHADDQAETILFRLLRGSGLKGLAGMAAATMRGPVTVLRPLLDCTKDDLIAFCERRGQAFFDDPSNRNPAYARTRMRALSRLLSENGLDRSALLKLGARLARADAALQERASSLTAGLVNLEPDGFKADVSPLAGEPVEILGRILDILIRRASGTNLPLRLDRIEALAIRLHEALARHQTLAATLGGMALHLDEKTYLSIAPEGVRRRGRNRDA